jgi:HEPN domain-containing protein
LSDPLRLKVRSYMLAPDAGVVEAVRKWVETADRDLLAASQLIKLGTATPADIVCFHAQQCVEKYLKALLTWLGLDFPKSHNLTRLLERLPERVRLAVTADERLRLTDYATVTRYPGDYEPITLAEARRAVAPARRVRRQVRGWLPNQALTA